MKVRGTRAIAAARTFAARTVLGVRVRSIIELLLGAALASLFLDKLRSTRGHVVWDWHTASAFGLEAVFVVALLALVALAFPRRRVVAWAVTFALSSLLMLTAATYASYAGGILTVRDVVLAGQVPEVWSSVTSLLESYWVRYTADLPIVLGLGLLAQWLLGPARSARRGRIAWATAAIGVVACIAMLARALALPAGVDDIAAARFRGLIAWQIVANFRSADGLDADEIPADPKALQALIDEVTGRTFGGRIADFAPGIAEGKSVIVVQMEALQEFAVGLTIDGRSMTPNLDRLIERSWYFPNTYSQVRKGTTADAEFIVNTSLYAPHAAASSIAYADRELTSLPRLLRETAGYRTVAFHTNRAAFWNRIRMMPALGFDTFYDRAYFGGDDVIGFGASDEVLWDKTADVLLDLDAIGDPFYAYVITVTSHHPFQALPAAKHPIGLPAPYDGTHVEDYLSNIEYADRAFGEFLKEYESSGLADHCVLVVLGDHFGLRPPAAGTPGAAALEAAVGREYDLVDSMRVPLIIRLPGQTEGRVVTDTVGQVDIMPTLADVLGLDLSATPHFGTSAFVEHTTLMQGTGLVTPGAYITDGVAVIPGLDVAGGTAVNLATHARIDPTTVPADTLDRIRRLAALSDGYVRTLPKDESGPLGEKARVPR